jgi:hypothetical protein
MSVFKTFFETVGRLGNNPSPELVALTIVSSIVNQKRESNAFHEGYLYLFVRDMKTLGVNSGTAKLITLNIDNRVWDTIPRTGDLPLNPLDIEQQIIDNLDFRGASKKNKHHEPQHFLKAVLFLYTTTASNNILIERERERADSMGKILSGLNSSPTGGGGKKVRKNRNTRKPRNTRKNRKSKNTRKKRKAKKSKNSKKNNKKK